MVITACLLSYAAMAPSELGTLSKAGSPIFGVHDFATGDWSCSRGTHLPQKQTSRTLEMAIPSEELSDQHHCSLYGTTPFATLKLNTPAIWRPSYPVGLASATMLGWSLGCH